MRIPKKLEPALFLFFMVGTMVLLMSLVLPASFGARKLAMVLVAKLVK